MYGHKTPKFFRKNTEPLYQTAAGTFSVIQRKIVYYTTMAAKSLYKFTYFGSVKSEVIYGNIHVIRERKGVTEVIAGFTPVYFRPMSPIK